MAIVKLLENQHIAELYWKCGWHMIMDSFILTLVYYERIVNIVCTILIDKKHLGIQMLLHIAICMLTHEQKIL